MADDGRNSRLRLLEGAREKSYEASSERRLTRRGVISRDRITEEALALLAEGGYPAVSIAAVCKRAEVSPASLYHHFGDKAGLLAAMIERSITDTLRGFVEIMSDHDRPLDRLAAFVRATREVGRERTNVISVLSALAQASGETPEIAVAVEQARTRAWRFSAAEWTENLGVDDGLFFTHITFAFASYIDHVGRSSTTRDDARALYKSYERALLITLAAARPDYMKDPEFAAAFAVAIAGDVTPTGETDHD